jgi:copper(I)-binding protein
MKHLFLIACALFALNAPQALAAENAAQAVKVGKSFVRAVPPGQKVSAAFMALNNTSKQDLKVISANSNVAQVVELHTHSHEDGMMKMRKIPAIDLPAGKTTILQPGGLHVMLIGLKKDLVPGQAVPVTLTFNDGSKKEIEIPVMQMTQMGGGMRMGNMQH